MIETSTKKELRKNLSEDELSSSDNEAPPAKKLNTNNSSANAHSTLYLDTIDRKRLDFDFEKLCSITLSQLNVYACLVCGKYFQGRGTSSKAYFHSLSEDHHVYINLEDTKIYILPEGYEVKDPSLRDIQHYLKPNFTTELIKKLDNNTQLSYDLNNEKYYPGFIGLNNIKANDYINVIIQALSHIKPIRDYFLSSEFRENTQLIQRFSLLIKKIWSNSLFKHQVSPHEFLQEVANTTSKKFTFIKQHEPVEFLKWFLNALQKDLTGGKLNRRNIISKCFKGKVRTVTTPVYKIDEGIREGIPEVVESPFMFLTLDVPPVPVFVDEVEHNIIPQIPLSTLLNKFDGRTRQESDRFIKTYKIIEYPDYLIFFIKRFSKNNFNLEKNSTIVNFPTINLNIYEATGEANKGEEGLYNLVANITHSGSLEDGQYSIQIENLGLSKWFKIQDLILEEATAQILFMEESYLQVWKRKNC